MHKVHRIAAIDQPSEMSKKWCVYSLADMTTNEVAYIGHIRLSQLFTFSDARAEKVDLDKFYNIIVLDMCDNSGMALRQRMIRAREYQIPVAPKPRSCRVLCVTTGETFNSIGEVAMQHGVAASNLSNHLNNKLGFNTVKGKVYKKVDNI